MKKQKQLKKRLKKLIINTLWQSYGPEDTLEKSLNEYVNEINKLGIKMDFEIIVYDKNYISVDYSIEDIKLNLTLKMIYD